MGFLCGKCMVFTIKQLQATIMSVIVMSCSNILLGMIILLEREWFELHHKVQNKKMSVLASM